MRFYESARVMLEKEGFREMNPSFESVEDGLRVYGSFPSYLERIEKFGIFAFGIGERIDLE